MPANTQAATQTVIPAALGSFLRDRRARLQPTVESIRRRTPGLRREEVATRAGVSVTWYTWLEQGRGGPPSQDVLERLSTALELDPASRELLFLLAQQRPPPLVPAPVPAVPAELQRVIDAFATSPAIVKTPLWDVVAWNRASAATLTDWSTVPADERNLMRRLFGSPAVKLALPDWEANARFVVAVFRIDVARIGGSAEADAIRDDLLASSADFRRIWAETEVRSYGIGVKRVRHPVAGLITFEHSAFAVSGADGLSMIVFTPATAEDTRRVEAVLASR